MKKFVLISTLLIIVVVLKHMLFGFNIFSFEKARSYYKKRDFEKVFIVPDIKASKLLSLDRKLFFSRLLDYASIANRGYLLRSGEFKTITKSAITLNPHSLNTLIIAGYQYATPTPNDLSNFYWVDKIIKSHINVAKQNWQLMLLMGYYWQWKVKNLNGIIPYAKALYHNKEASLSVRETYPILLSKLNDTKKAILFYQVLLKHTKDKAEKKWIQEQIKKLKTKHQ